MSGNQYTNPKHYYNYPEYSVWVNMRRRCRERDGYTNRGIGVCERWENSFENFIRDMDRRPSSQHSIDREDNDGGYNPSNCRWVTSSTQSKNRRNSRLITHRGVTMNAVDWAAKVGVSKESLGYRLKAGWSLERALPC